MSPRTPWARPVRPTSSTSVDEVDVDLGAVAGGGSAHDRANALCSAASAADDATEVARTDGDFQPDATLRLAGGDGHGFGIVHDGLDHMHEHGRGRGCERVAHGHLLA